MPNRPDTTAAAADEAEPATETSFDVFISHASADRAPALRLRQALVDAGLRPWASFSDIPLGAPYPVRIDRAIPACRALVLLVSRASMASEHVFRELAQAASANKRIMPIYIEADVPVPEGRRYYLQSLHRVKISPDAIGTVAGLVAASIHDHDVWLREAQGPGVMERLAATPLRSWFRLVGAALLAGMLVWAIQLAWLRYDSAQSAQQRDALPESLGMLSLIGAEKSSDLQTWQLQFNVILADSRTRFSDLGLTLHSSTAANQAGTDIDLTDAVRTDQVGGGRMYAVPLRDLGTEVVACLTMPHPHAGQRWRLSTPFKAAPDASQGGQQHLSFQQSGVAVARVDDASPCR